MIIEGILTTSSEDGRPHHAPMGPWVDEALQSWILKPFQSSVTFRNLRSQDRCVFHVVDDALLLVQSALSLPTDITFSPCEFGGWIIDSACQWFCLELMAWDTRPPRAEVTARVLGKGCLRPFWGWNRAKHAVLEGTILATRLHLLGRQQVLDEFRRLEPIIQKTAGSREAQAWSLLENYVRDTQTNPEV